MRPWLLLLSMLVCALPGLADDFPDDFTPTFKFRETYKDVVVADPDLPGEYLTRGQITLTFDAELSIKGLDLSTLDSFSPVTASIGGIDFQDLLGSGSDYDENSPNPQLSRVTAIDKDAFDTKDELVENAGLFKVTWLDGQRVKFSFKYLILVSAESDSILLQDFIGLEEPEIEDALDVTLEFGPYSLTRRVYVTGKATLTQDPPGRVPDDLSNVTLDGSFDTIAPSVAFTSPAPSQTSISVDQVHDGGLYDFAGTVRDTRAVNGQTFEGSVNRVEVRVSDTQHGGTFEEAILNGDGTWSLPDVALFPGTNWITVRAYDDDGNVRTSTPRSIPYRFTAIVTMQGTGTGYPPGASLAAGTVSGSFRTVDNKTIKKTITVPAGGSVVQFVSPAMTTGNLITFNAKPGVGSVFNGWVGTVDGNVVLESPDAELRFEIKPRLVLTASFTPNPFNLSNAGKYQGLITGNNSAGRGVFNFSISKTSSFTGSIKLGTLSLSLSGKMPGSGEWEKTIVKSGKSYHVALTMNVAPDGDRQVTGTITGDGISSTFIADLNLWKTMPGQAMEYAGDYNVLLPPDPSNTNPNFPVGIGYGRVNISKLGVVKFAGRLGDNSKVSCSGVLVKRSTGDPEFPFFIALDKKLGGVAGIVVLSDEPTSDLAGTLDWEEPPTTGTEPQAFAGKIALHGSRYVAPPKFPAAGSRVMLNDTSGQGQITLEAPAFSKPANVTPFPLGPFEPFAVTLDPRTNAILPPIALPAPWVQNFTLKFKTSTGTFSGSYKDFLLATKGKTVSFGGIVSQKANVAGGTFTRGNRSGVILLEPPAP